MAEIAALKDYAHTGTCKDALEKECKELHWKKISNFMIDFEF